MSFDLNQWVGYDLSSTVVGDLYPIDGATKGQQRILRRLLTNPGDYIFHPDYGAGLAAKVGSVGQIGTITALVREQMKLEACVAQVPEPVITVTEILNGISVSIRYTDVESNTPQTLSFNVNI